MAISTKVKALLNSGGKDHAGLATTHLGIIQQTLSSKFYRDSFSAAGLVKVVEYTESYLPFVFPDDSKVVIDSTDIKA